MAPDPSPDRSSVVAWAEWALIVAGFLVLRFALRHDIVGDDHPRFEMLSSLLTSGRHFQGNKYSLVGPALASPLWLVGRALGDAAEGVLSYDWLLLGGALLAFYFLLRKRWSPEALRAFLLLLVAGSMFPRHVLHFGAEAFTTVFAGVGLAFIALGPGPVGWPLLVLSAVNTPASLPAMGLATLRWSWERKRLRYLAVPAVAAGLVLLDTWVRMGSPFHTGYEADAGVRTVMPYSGLIGLSYPLFFGLLSLTLSFGKGLAFFAPGLLLLPVHSRLGLPDGLRAVCRLWLAFTLGLLLLYSTYWGWYGGASAGPRYLLFASLPATLLLAQFLTTAAARWQTALVALLMVALCCWGVVATTVFENGGMNLCLGHNYQLEALCWYTPEFSVLWNPFVSPTWDRSTGARVVMAYQGLVFLVISRALVKTLFTAGRRGLTQALGQVRSFRL